MVRKITHKKHFLVNFFTPILLLLCPYIYFIEFNRYGFFNYEALVIFAACFLIGTILGLLFAKLQWVGRVLILSMSMTITLSFFPAFHSIVVIQIAFFIVLLICIFLMDYLIPLVPIIAFAFIIATIFLPMKHEFTASVYSHHQVESNKNLPPVINIILDEHVGIDAIPTNLPGGVKLQKQLTQFYKSNGFELYPNAYSHYARTYNSIPNLVNFIPQAKNALYFPNGIKHLVLKQNTALQLLSKQGYAIDIFQPYYINFCKGKDINLESCYTYPVYSLPYEKELKMPRKSHLIYLTKSFLYRSTIYQMVVVAYSYSIRPMLAYFSIDAPRFSFAQTQIAPLAVPATFEQLTKAIVAHPNGRAFFVHILMPHYTYIYNQYCQADPDVNNWLENHDVGPPGNSPDRRRFRYGLYEGQLRCDYKLLGNLFDRLKQAGVYDKSIIIISGDHSSRIMQVAPVDANIDKVTWQDFEDTYATLFAVKWPGQKGYVNYARKPITLLYANIIQKITHQPITKDKAKPYVYLTVSDTSQHTAMEIFPLTGFKANRQ